MKRISNGAKWAILFFLAVAVLATIIGLVSIQQKGDDGGSFWAVGGSLVIALIIYLISRRVDVVPVLALLLLAGHTGCATHPGPKLTQLQQDARLFPYPPMVTDTAGWTGPKLVTAR